MDQSLKGEDINYIGQIDALGIDKKNDLRKLDYDDQSKPGQEKEPNKFFKKQEEERKKAELMREDRHLLPVEKFIDPLTGEKVDDKFKLPFGSIDVIFNHKNIWANLQNPNPQVIMYHIHDNLKWLPLIHDPFDEHPRVKKARLIAEGITMDAPVDAKPKKKSKKKGKKGGDGQATDPEIFQMKFKGDFAKPFMPFYDAKAMEPPLTDKQVEKIEAKIYKEVEIAMKQVRSSRNLNCNIKNNHMTRTIMRKYIDYLEDTECLRILKPETALKNVNKEVRKLVPESYKISMLPAFFNHTDGERLGTVIRDTSSKFLVDTPKKVMFSIAVKIFPYNSGVNSVRVVLVKLHPFEGMNNENGQEKESSKKSKKSKSSRSKSQADP